jgi:hypothetical protein
MSVKPVVMCGESVRATLAGRKTMMRRVIKSSGLKHDDIGRIENMGVFTNLWKIYHWRGNYVETIRPPYEVGDILYVREAWRVWSWHEGEPIFVQFKTDGAIKEAWYDEDDYPEFGPDWEWRMMEQSAKDCEKAGWDLGPDNIFEPPDDYTELPTRWRSSIHMPKFCSRLRLEVTGCKPPERVRDISEDDVIAEGCALRSWGQNNWPRTAAFAEHWDSLNAKRGYPWESNPWVWPVEYRVKESK